MKCLSNGLPMLQRSKFPRTWRLQGLRECSAQSLRLASNAADATVTEAPTRQVKNATTATLRTSSSSLEDAPWSGLERLPTAALLRSLFLGVFFSSPTLFKPGFAFLRIVANSRSRLLNPDSNPVLRAILKSLLYDHFCAGTTRSEVIRTRDSIRQTGYSGVALCYGKEAPSSHRGADISIARDTVDAEIEHWKQGNLETLDMIGAGDWLAMKFTGAGSRTTEALLQNDEPPAQFVAAMHSICDKTLERGCLLWIDAEQQNLQKSIDTWAIRFMSRYNRDGKVVVYNTLQSYLKTSRSKLEHQLALADRGNWTLAIKLVRGAYMGSEQRHLINDTKQDTDDAYNGIVSDLLAGTNLGYPDDRLPKVELLLAGHNPESVSKAWNLIGSLRSQGKLKVLPAFAQLQGMGDELGCRFLQLCEKLEADQKEKAVVAVPKMYKCLTWGTLQECMLYLFRRAVENSGGTDRMRDGMAAYRGELKRRVFGRRPPRARCL